MTDRKLPRIIVISGGMAAGKLTAAQALAERFRPKSVHLRGDIYRKMIVNGREAMGPDLSPEALRQLLLRYGLACDAAWTRLPQYVVMLTIGLLRTSLQVRETALVGAYRYIA